MRFVLFLCSLRPIPASIIRHLNEIVETQFEATINDNQENQIFEMVVRAEYKDLTGIRQIQFKSQSIQRFLFYDMPPKFASFFSSQTISADDKLTILEGFLGDSIQKHPELCAHLSLIPPPHGITDEYSSYAIGLLYRDERPCDRLQLFQEYKARLPSRFKKLFGTVKSHSD